MPNIFIDDFLNYNHVLSAPQTHQDNLNVNGKKLYQNGDKSIWSYNPEDASINFIKVRNKSAQQSRPSSRKSSKRGDVGVFGRGVKDSSTTATAAAVAYPPLDHTINNNISKEMRRNYSYSASYIPSSVDDATSINTTTTTGNKNNLNQVDSYNYILNASTTSKLNGFKLYEMVIPITSTRVTKPQIKYPSKLSTKLSDTNSPDEQLVYRLDKQRQLDDQEYQNNLSRIIKTRYTSEPYLMQTQSSMAKARPPRGTKENENNESTAPTGKTSRSKSRVKSSKITPKQLLYSKHIDSLTAELMSVLSEDYNKGLFNSIPGDSKNGGVSEELNKMTQSDIMINDDTDDYIEVYDDNEEILSGRLEAGDVGTAEPQLEMSDDDDDNLEDDEEYHDFEAALYGHLDPSDYVDLENPDKIRVFNKDNVVMKICNEIRSDIDRNKKLSKKLRRRLRNLDLVEVNRDKEPDVDDQQKKEESDSEQKAKELDNEFPADYFDKIGDDEIEFEYTNTINDDLTTVLQAYDGMTTVEQYLKQHAIDSKTFQQSYDDDLPSKAPIVAKENINEDRNDDFEHSHEVESTDNFDKLNRMKKSQLESEKNAEMFNIFKRMMVKKKYVLSTIKFEKEFGFTFRRYNKLIAKMRPSTATQVSSSVNTNDLKPSNRPRTACFTENEVNDMNKSSLAAPNQADLYEPFRLSPTVINQQEWPYEVELDLDRPKLFKRLQSSKSNKSSSQNRCYPCKKLPVVNVTPPKESSNAVSTSDVPANEQNLPIIKQPLPISQINMPAKKFPKLKSQNESSNQTENTKMNDPITKKSISTSNLLNATYNSARRSISAKLQMPPSDRFNPKSADAMSATSYVNGYLGTENIEIIDLNDLVVTKNDELSVSDGLDFESEELLFSKRNLDLKKEDQLKKMNLIPGKTFYSQRSKSISIDHIPNSKKKLDSQKARIPFTMSGRSGNRSSLGGQQHYRLAKSGLDAENELNGENEPVDPTPSNERCQLVICNLNASKPSMKLAVQHKEEIYTLINKNSKIKEVMNLTKVSATELTSTLMLTKSNVKSNADNSEKLALINDAKKSLKSTFKPLKRPKTSKL